MGVEFGSDEIIAPRGLSRRAGLAAALASAGLLIAPRRGRADPPAGALTLRTAPLAFHAEDPQATRVGKLAWRGGLALRTDHAAFGGWSGLWVADDGQSLRAVSDEGAWLVARLRTDPARRLAGLEDARLGRLKGPDGAVLAGKSWTDAESLAVLADGSLLVGFERRHRLLRYPAGDERRGGGLAGTPAPFPAPPALARAPANAGLEAMTALQDGRLFLLSEAHTVMPGTTSGWIGTMRGGAPHWSAFHYTLVDGFRPTAAAALPDGDVVILERSVELLGGWRVRVMRLKAAALAPDAVVRAEELARLETPVVTENLEGVAARSGPGGETLLWLMSDDNFSPWQQSVLLHFALGD
jgi:hypothetical protein